MAAFTTMIPEMNFMPIQRAISLMIANEMASQKEIFVPALGDEQAFLNDYAFTVSDGLYFTEDMSKFPLLNVYFEKINNNGENDEIQGFNGDYSLNLDMFVFRADAVQEDETVIDGSTGADKRLGYFASQVYQIMEAQVNNQLKTNGLIDGYGFLQFKKDVNNPNIKGLSYNTVALMGRITYNIKITQNKEINIGEDMNEFLIGLNLDEKDLGEILIQTGV